MTPLRSLIRAAAERRFPGRPLAAMADILAPRWGLAPADALTVLSRYLRGGTLSADRAEDLIHEAGITLTAPTLEENRPIE